MKPDYFFLIAYVLMLPGLLTYSHGPLSGDIPVFTITLTIIGGIVLFYAIYQLRPATKIKGVTE